MTDDRYLVKPLPNEDGKRLYRLEIDEFLQNNEMTNLFLIALAALQKDSLRQLDNKEPDWLTYYNLAGIHGEPKEKWNGYSPTEYYGFCHHSKNTFPTWHRPYMLLFESTVYREMVRLANLYETPEEREVYLNAAAQFRLPYWDIIMPRNSYDKDNKDETHIFGCPQLLKEEWVWVREPGNNPKFHKGFSRIRNPLYSFYFPKTWPTGRTKPTFIVKRVNRPPSTYDEIQTIRLPHMGENGKLEHGNVDRAIQRKANDFATMIWQMLNPDHVGERIDKVTEDVGVLINEVRSWESFANDEVDEEVIGGHAYSTVSLESFHDDIHVLLGTSTIAEEKFRDSEGRDLAGHMGNPMFAAFDPIFWLHHNNIERLFCLFQAMYPNKYVSVAESQQELFPFMKSSNRTCFRSSDDLVKSYQGSGFAIPPDRQLSDKELEPAALKKKLKEYLTNTYYWATTNAKFGRGSQLAGWPKKFSSSWALQGENFNETEAPVVEMQALSLKAGVLELVTRELLFDTPELAVEETVIPVSQTLKLAQAVESSLPRSFSQPMAESGGPARSIAGPHVRMTWNAHVKVRKFAFDGSFSVHLFIGHVKDDQPWRYMTKKNEAGFMGVFASPWDAECPSCERNREKDIIVGNVVPLTAILCDYLDEVEGSEGLIRDADLKTIPNLNPEHVVPFLQENLQWRIIDLGAKLLEGQEQQAKLEITVTSRPFIPPTEDHLMGVYGPHTPYPSITSGKPGGYGYVYP